MLVLLVLVFLELNRLTKLRGGQVLDRRGENGQVRERSKTSRHPCGPPEPLFLFLFLFLGDPPFLFLCGGSFPNSPVVPASEGEGERQAAR